MTTREEQVTRAVEGAVFTLRGRTRSQREELVVGPKCDANDGRWVCTTHGEMFGNQFEKDMHISGGRHVLAWWCHVCGRAEVP